MNAKARIQEALKRIMSEGEANACQIWKGYDAGTWQTGWHYEPFGRTATCLGNSVTEALQTIADIAVERSEVG